jgi:hypothetical protein
MTKFEDRLFNVGIPSFRCGLMKSLLCSYYAFRIPEDTLLWFDSIITRLQ